MDYKEIVKIPLNQYDDKIPLLKAVLQSLNLTYSLLFIELKVNHNDDRCKMAEALVLLFSTMPATHAIKLMSFDFEILNCLKKHKKLQEIQLIPILARSQLLSWINTLSIEQIIQQFIYLDGINIEMGFYLQKEKYKTLLKQLKKEKKIIISWPNYAERTDNLFYFNLAQDIGIDYFTSDLSVEIVFQNQFLLQKKNHIEKKLIQYQSSYIHQGIIYFILGKQKAALYCPCEADFVRAYQHPIDGLNLERLYPLVQKEIALLRIHANQILVSLHLVGKLTPIFFKIFTQKSLRYHCKIVDSGSQKKSLVQINNYLD